MIAKCPFCGHPKELYLNEQKAGETIDIGGYDEDVECQKCHGIYSCQIEVWFDSVVEDVMPIQEPEEIPFEDKDSIPLFVWPQEEVEA